MQSTSDQILVSEMAILIAAVVGHNEITVYSLDIIIALACLASTVHLATFPLLVKDLKNHSFAKHIRVFIMCSAAVILVFWLICQLVKDWDSVTGVYFHCLTWRSELAAADVPNLLLSVLVPLSVLNGTFNAVRLLYGRNDDDSDSNNRLVDSQEGTAPRPVPNGVRRPGETGQRTQGEDRGLSEDNRITQPPGRVVDQSNRSYSHDDGQSEGSTSRRRTTHTHRIPSVVSGEQGHELEEIDLEQGHPRVLNERRIVPGPRSRDQSGPENQSHLPKSPKGIRTVQLKSSPSAWKREKSRLMLLWLKDEARGAIRENRSVRCQRALVWRLSEAWAFHQCQNSFMGRILWLWSANVYGVTSVFIARDNTEGMSGDRDKFGFGQIIPLALLLLPLFAATQARNGKIVESPTPPFFVSCWFLADIKPAEYVKATSKSQAETSVATQQQPPTIYARSGRFDPDISSWAQGTKPTSSFRVKVSVGIYAFVMFAFLTALGFFTAYGADPVLAWIFLVIPILISFRQYIFTRWLKRKYQKDKKTIQESRQNDPQDQSEQMMTAEAAGNIAPEDGH